MIINLPPVRICSKIAQAEIILDAAMYSRRFFRTIFSNLVILLVEYAHVYSNVIEVCPINNAGNGSMLDPDIRQEGFLLQTEICQPSTGVKTWISITSL